MEAVQVMRDDGQQGTVVQRITTAEAAPQLVSAFADGSQLVVPEDGLIAPPDGTYHLRRPQTALVKEGPKASGVDEPLVVPVVAEELPVEKRQVTKIETIQQTRRRTDVELEEVPGAQRKDAVRFSWERVRGAR